MGNLTIARIREVLDYDRETGVFTWRVRLSNRALAGAVAGAGTPKSYRTIRIDGKPYSAAWLAWAHVTGEFPRSIVDHRSRDKADNRFANLRLATTQQNAFNVTRHRDGRVGLKGVHNHPGGRFRAQITRGGKRVHLGLFGTAEAAHAAYCKAAAERFGEFATAGHPKMEVAGGEA